MSVSEDQSASTTTVTTEGPVAGGREGRPFGAELTGLGEIGYVEQEYFISGQATAFEPIGDLSVDGRWSVRPTGVTGYKTRILVRRPSDPAAFNGTVVVEWANVSLGFDVLLASMPVPPYGFAYVGVSAQRVGLHGSSRAPGVIQWDTDRYQSLHIPHDGLSFDIFTQIGNVLKGKAAVQGPAPQGGLEARRLIAVGGSQAAARLLSYANAIQPREDTFDAILPFLGGGWATDFDGAPAWPDSAVQDHGGRRVFHARLRDDLTVPVIVVSSETEAVPYSAVRQDDNDFFRYWEIAGASHAPTGTVETLEEYHLRHGLRQAESNEVLRSNVMWLPSVEAAIVQLDGWSAGQPPPHQPPIVLSSDSTSIVRDEHGNAMGGLRLPEVEVPIATYEGVGDDDFSGGTTTPFDQATVRDLYPTHAEYVDQVRRAAARAEEAGTILADRATAYVKAAEAASIP